MLSKHEQIFAIKNNRENLTKFNASVGKKNVEKVLEISKGKNQK